MGKNIIMETRSRIFVEGAFDIAPVVKTFGGWAESKKLFISSRYLEKDNCTIVLVKPFERIHREVAMQHVGAQKNQIMHEHEIVFYGTIPSEDGSSMSLDELTKTVIMPSKRAVKKTVAICTYGSKHEELGSAKTKFVFYVDSRAEDPEGDLSRCKDEVSERLLDIVDSHAADGLEYAKSLDALTHAIARFIETL